MSEANKTEMGEDLVPMVHPAQNRCFGCGEANRSGLRLKFLLAPDGLVVCRVTIADSFEGRAGYLHGGVIATLLDETMSKAVRAQGVTAMTRELMVEYLRPVPSRTPLRIEGRVIGSDGRKHRAEATILNDDGKALAHGKGLFVEPRLGSG